MKNTIQTILRRWWAYIKIHKIISAVIVVIIFISGYYGYKKVFAASTTPTYVYGAVERGTLINSVSGTGQVSSSNEVDIKPKVGGDIVSVTGAVGQEVKEGTVIARIDSKDAQTALTKAGQSLASAKIAYQKALQQSQTSVTNTQQSVESAEADITTAYKEGYDAVVNTFIDIPAIMIGMDAIYYTPSHSPYFSDQQIRAAAGDIAVTYKYQAGVTYDKAKNDYTPNFNAYKATSASSDPQTIIDLIKQTQKTVGEFQEALTGAYNTIDLINLRTTQKPSEINTDEAAITSYRTKITSDVQALSNALKGIQDAEQHVIDAKTSLSNSQVSLNGVDTLDIQAAKLTLAQQQTAYQDTRDTLADYSIKAPFDGVIAALSIEKGDAVTSGTSVATVVTQQQIATLSLNELDAVKVKNGQKATLTFDAVEELSISGNVIELDAIGTVSQGVVSYNAKIAFDTQDERIKSGMSASATIITSSKQDVLLVPSSAVKTSGSTSYVQIKGTSSVPQQIQVEVGETNDTETEIISGLKEGDEIVTRAVSSSATTNSSASTQQRSGATSILGGNSGGRFPR